MTNPPLTIRRATRLDIPTLCTILNEIIAIGGTTALEKELSESEFFEYYFDRETAISCFVATDIDNTLVGFQTMGKHIKLDDDWADIATFSRVTGKIPGVGRTLFRATVAHAESLKLTAINATIRADNIGGLAYYDKMGFENYAIQEQIPLSDGTLIDRIQKKYVVNSG